MLDESESFAFNKNGDAGKGEPVSGSRRMVVDNNQVGVLNFQWSVVINVKEWLSIEIKRRRRGAAYDDKRSP